jgi:hypothetical protein
MKHALEDTLAVRYGRVTGHDTSGGKIIPYFLKKKVVDFLSLIESLYIATSCPVFDTKIDSRLLILSILLFFFFFSFFQKPCQKVESTKLYENCSEEGNDRTCSEFDWGSS